MAFLRSMLVVWILSFRTHRVESDPQSDQSVRLLLDVDITRSVTEEVQKKVHGPRFLPNERIHSGTRLLYM